jgi:hypothetical protein
MNRPKTDFFCADMDEPCIMDLNAEAQALGTDTWITYDSTG